MVSVALTDRCYGRGEKPALSRFANAHRLSELRGLLSGQRLRDRPRGALGALRALPQRLAPAARGRGAAAVGLPASAVPREPAGDATVAAFKSELGPAPAAPQQRPSQPPAVEAAAAAGHPRKRRPGRTAARPADRNACRRSAGRRAASRDRATPPRSAEIAIPAEQAPPTAPPRRAGRRPPATSRASPPAAGPSAAPRGAAFRSAPPACPASSCCWPAWSRR